MKKLIKKILRESDFDWIEDVPERYDPENPSVGDVFMVMDIVKNASLLRYYGNEIVITKLSTIRRTDYWGTFYRIAFNNEGFYEMNTIGLKELINSGRLVYQSNSKENIIGENEFDWVKDIEPGDKLNTKFTVSEIYGELNDRLRVKGNYRLSYSLYDGKYFITIRDKKGVSYEQFMVDEFGTITLQEILDDIKLTSDKNPDEHDYVSDYRLLYNELIGYDYYDVDKSINESDDFEWVSQHLDSVPDDPHHLALMKCYGNGVLDGLELQEWDHYGLNSYENTDNERFVVGVKDEYVEALKKYYGNLVDEVGFGDWNTNIIDPQDYVYITDTDIRLYADDMSSSYADDMDIEDIIELTSYSERYNELENKISELDDKIIGVENRQTDLINQDLEETDEYRELEYELIDLEGQLKGYVSIKDGIGYDAKQEYQNEMYENYKHQLEVDPVRFFIDMGIRTSVSNMVEYGDLSFDSERFINDLSEFRYYGDISSDDRYCMEYVDGEDYVCIKID